MYIERWSDCFFDSIRLYDSDLTQLGSLRYHKDTVHALSFVQTRILSDLKRGGHDREEESDSEESEDEKEDEIKNDHLLVSGGEEGRICLWKT